MLLLFLYVEKMRNAHKMLIRNLKGRKWLYGWETKVLMGGQY